MFYKLRRLTFVELSCVLACVFSGATIARAGVTNKLRPEIFCEFTSRQAPIDKSMVRIFVDGDEKTADAEISSWRVSWVSPVPMSVGEHFVRVEVNDVLGGNGVKEWSFTIDPTANISGNPSIKLISSSIAGGAVVANGKNVKLDIELTGEGAGGIDAGSVRSNIYKDGALLRDYNPRSQFFGKMFSMDFGGLATGYYSAAITVADRLNNVSNEINSAFTVDATPPVITSFSGEIKDVNGGKALVVKVAAHDEPADNLKTIVLKPGLWGNAIDEFSAPAREGDNVITVDVSSVDPKFLGQLEYLVVLSDIAGNTAMRRHSSTPDSAQAPTLDFELVDNLKPISDGMSLSAGQPVATAAPAAVPPGAPSAPVVASVAPQLLVDNSQNVPGGDSGFFINELPRDTLARAIDVSGHAPAGSYVEIVLNSASLRQAFADDAGFFLFRNISLSEGENRIYASILNDNEVASRQTPEKVVMLSEAPAPEPPAVEPPVIVPVEPPVDEPPAVEPPEPGLPEVIVTSPHNGDTVTNGKVDVIGMAVADGKGVSGALAELLLNGKIVMSVRTDAEGRFEFTDVPLKDGENIIYVSLRTPNIAVESGGVVISASR